MHYVTDDEAGTALTLASETLPVDYRTVRPNIQPYLFLFAFIFFSPRIERKKGGYGRAVKVGTPPNHLLASSVVMKYKCILRVLNNEGKPSSLLLDYLKESISIVFVFFHFVSIARHYYLQEDPGRLDIRNV